MSTWQFNGMKEIGFSPEKVKADAKAVVVGENQQKNGQKKVYTEEEKRKYWTEWLSKASDKQIDDLIDKYGDEKKYPNLCALIKAETDKRAKADMERWYRENGERA